MADLNGWISVKDRLPEHDEEVVLYPDFAGEPVVGYKCSQYGFFFDNDGREVKPTHWIALPEPPCTTLKS